MQKKTDPRGRAARLGTLFLVVLWWGPAGAQTGSPEPARPGSETPPRAVAPTGTPAATVKARPSARRSSARPSGLPSPTRPSVARPSPEQLRKTTASAARKAAREIVYRRLYPVPLPERTRAYVEKTSDTDQLKAERFFKMGNRKFEQRDLDQAIRLYEQAYKVWPHPRILYNIAINLGYLSNPLESARKFRKVLQYKPGPIQPRRYEEAARLYQRLMRRLGTLRVVCNERNARLFVDGMPLGTAPVDKTVTVLPGRHLVSAKLQGKVPYSAEVNLTMGYQATVTVVMRDFADVVRYKKVKRYGWYWPVAVTAVAAVALAVGTGLWISGRNTILDMKDEIDADFTSVKGPITYPKGTEGRAVDFQHAGQVMVGVGAAATAASVVLWLLRTKRVRYTVESGPTSTGPEVKIRF